MPKNNTFPNLAGIPMTDDVNQSELEAAGISFEKAPEFMRKKMGSREVDTVVIGSHLGWSFERSWYYWIAQGPGIPYEFAKELDNQYGGEARVSGCAGGQAPEDFKGFAIGSYHIDTPEGLLAFRETLDKVHAAFLAKQ